MKQPLNLKWHRLWLLLRRWERCQESFTTDSLGSSGPHGRFGSFASDRVCPLSGLCGPKLLRQGRDGPEAEIRMPKHDLISLDVRRLDNRPPFLNFRPLEATKRLGTLLVT